MINFIDAERGELGVEPICKYLPIAPSTYYDYLAKRQDENKLCLRTKTDIIWCQEIKYIYEDNMGVYGARKVWRQMLRNNISIARCTVERLMKATGIQGVRRGKKPKTTISNHANLISLDKVDRHFHAPHPNQLWVADFTYVRTSGNSHL